MGHHHASFGVRLFVRIFVLKRGVSLRFFVIVIGVWMA
jgi:hypothetical protein